MFDSKYYDPLHRETDHLREAPPTLPLAVQRQEVDLPDVQRRVQAARRELARARRPGDLRGRRLVLARPSFLQLLPFLLRHAIDRLDPKVSSGEQ